MPLGKDESGTGAVHAPPGARVVAEIESLPLGLFTTYAAVIRPLGSIASAGDS